MSNITKWFAVGVAIIVGIQIFKFQDNVSENVISRVKTKDMEQIAIAGVITVGLGMVAVILASTLKGR